ncbi:hypothetical protein [Glutamicibacter nicotianae]|uniref:hypothetical protein n=1 Tax=Glutamicibacter nicotianae TaxID=37929 RepID=UPI0019585C10|nr:hypothetical protein [Glutamicibacter nicotianae]MBM7769254.1 Mrp family chromosome partitioning ATPase [Glutamicibacter nicotianae]
MKWLSESPSAQPLKVAQRFVMTESDFEQLPPKRTGAPAAGERTAEDEPVCTIVSNDARIIERCAVIAVGAAVRINQCADPQLLPGDGSGPVLWGSDMAALAENTSRPVDVLVGMEDGESLIWTLASRIPKARVAVLPSASQWLGEYLGLWAMRAGHGHTLALSSTAGGLGTTTLAVLLAHAGTLSGLRSAMIDLDPHSQGAWPLVCAQPPAGIGWEELQQSGGALAAHQLAETLPKLRDTTILTWSRANRTQELEDQLVIRLLAAARQGFDLVVVDAGRAPHPQRLAMNQFIDRNIATASSMTVPALGEVVLCGEQKLRCTPQGFPEMLGAFPVIPRISKALERGQLFDTFKSRALRQHLSNLCLIPQVKEQRP